MLPVFTSEEMRACDQAAIEQYGIPGIVLMENAARGAVDLAETLFGSCAEKLIVIVCGNGNNGGDGFAMARHFMNRGATVEVLTLGADTGIRGDAKTNLDILRKLEKESRRLHVALLAGSQQLSAILLRRPHMVVDAIFGTGLASPIKGDLAEFVEVLNSSSIPVLAVDIPSGINAETGEVMGCAIHAKHTATMGSLKRGLLLRQGREHAGTVHVVDIGMPNYGYVDRAATTFRLELSDIVHWLPRRAFNVHKYQLGNVFVLAGSTGLTGAAVMASEAALGSGAGVVHLGVPAGLNNVLETKLTEVMTIPFKETAEGTLSLNDFDRIIDRVNTSSISIIGPGISRHYETQNLVRRIVEHATAPLLIDADALFALVGHLDLLLRKDIDIILTPHVGEFSRLVVQSKEEIEIERISIAQTFAVEFGVILVLKGAPTVIATKEGKVYINPTGNPGMATAGAGDVLSGIIAGLAAQDCSAEEAACMGVYLHGLAGDHARDRVGEYGLIATDLIASFATILKDVTPRATT